MLAERRERLINEEGKEEDEEVGQEDWEEKKSTVKKEGDIGGRSTNENDCC